MGVAALALVFSAAFTSADVSAEEQNAQNRHAVADWP
jgi:hypothetical protein